MTAVLSTSYVYNALLSIVLLGHLFCKSQLLHLFFQLRKRKFKWFYDFLKNCILTALEKIFSLWNITPFSHQLIRTSTFHVLTLRNIYSSSILYVFLPTLFNYKIVIIKRPMKTVFALLGILQFPLKVFPIVSPSATQLLLMLWY